MANYSSFSSIRRSLNLVDFIHQAFDCLRIFSAFSVFSKFVMKFRVVSPNIITRRICTCWSLLLELFKVKDRDKRGEKYLPCIVENAVDRCPKIFLVEVVPVENFGDTSCLGCCSIVELITINRYNDHRDSRMDTLGQSQQTTVCHVTLDVRMFCNKTNS